MKYDILRAKVHLDINGNEYYYFYCMSKTDAYQELENAKSEGYIVGFDNLEIIEE